MPLVRRLLDQGSARYRQLQWTNQTTDPRSISISRKPSRTPEVLLPNGSGISSKAVGLVKPCYNPICFCRCRSPEYL